MFALPQFFVCHLIPSLRQNLLFPHATTKQQQLNNDMWVCASMYALNLKGAILQCHSLRVGQ